jgi:hypothetical protein
MNLLQLEPPANGPELTCGVIPFTNVLSEHRPIPAERRLIMTHFLCVGSSHPSFSRQLERLVRPRSVHETNLAESTDFLQHFLLQKFDG